MGIRDRCLDQCDAALDTLERVGTVDRRAQGRVALLRARARLARGEHAQARRLFDTAVQCFAAVRDRHGLAAAACGQGQLHRLLGEWGPAAASFSAALAQNAGRDLRIEAVAWAA